MLIVDTSLLDEEATGFTSSEVYWIYNGLDCCITMEIFEVLEQQLDEVTRETYRVAMETVGPVMEMMLEGLPVNNAARDKAYRAYEAQYFKLEHGFKRLCCEGLDIPADRRKRKGRSPVPVNIASPKDVQFLFHEVLGIPEKRKLRKGASEATATSDRETLEGFRNYFFAEPFVNYILAMRDAGKAMGFLKTPLDTDNKIRCSFNVAGTNTGRMASSFSDMGTGTNLQNISGRQKGIFWAEHGWVIVDVDLEQGDSRGVGALCWNFFLESHGEEFAGKYLDACESGDLHTTVCRMAWPNLDWGVDPSGWRKVANQLAYRDKSYRDLSKVLGHGSNYMGQPTTMAGHTKTPSPIIQEFQKSYFGAFPCIQAWQKETIRRVQTTGQLTSLWGRRRYFWGDTSKQSVLNAAIAYDPQSTTGEFTNRGMLQLFKIRNKLDLPIRFLLQVHDSLVFMVKEDRLNETIPQILNYLRVVKRLKGGREFSIPHGCKVGWNYGSASEENPYGLSAWKGEESRRPPKRVATLSEILSRQISGVR